jgi:hypothetical protein
MMIDREAAQMRLSSFGRLDDLAPPVNYGPEPEGSENRE